MEFQDCLDGTLQELDSAKDVFRNLFSFQKVAYCILYYIILYPVSRVNFFNVKHLVVRKIYVAFYTQRYSHVS